MLRFTLGSLILIASILIGILSEGCAKAPSSDNNEASSSMPTTISTNAQ